MRDRLRHALLIAAALSGLAIFGAVAVYEEPGLGLGHFFYVPIILAALATGPAISAGAAIIATAMYASGVIVIRTSHRARYSPPAPASGSSPS